MSTVPCACLKRRDIFVSVLLAHMVLSTLSALAAVALYWSSANPATIRLQPNWRPYVASPCQTVQLNWSTDGNIELKCRC